jgi:hypothetical protein
MHPSLAALTPGSGPGQALPLRGSLPFPAGGRACPEKILRPDKRANRAVDFVLAGLVPAIRAFASHRSARRDCVDARIKSGHDELIGLMHHLKESEH